MKLHIAHIVSVCKRNSQTVLFGVSLCILLVSLLVLGKAMSIERHHYRAGQTHQNHFAIGSTVTQGEASMTITSVTRNSGSGTFIAPAGKHYEVITLKITNTGTAPFNIAPTNDTYAKTTDGVVSYVAAMSLTDPFRAGELAAGETIQGQLSYLVSDNQPVSIYIDAIWSGGVIPFQIRTN